MRAFFYPGGASGHGVQRPAAALHPLHFDLSLSANIEMEVTYDNHQALPPEQTAYFNAVLDYVKECRPLLNQGQYQLPEPPRLADFDVELQEYKAHVMDEIQREAAAAGMTVEEYAANGYEPAPPAGSGAG